jgi:precorrin-6Y C5,15-methyltransferase (decarboxylating)
LVVGHRRHLELAAVNGEAVEWDGSLGSLDGLLEGYGEGEAVLLASGDPDLFGLGSSLLVQLGAEAVDVEPAVSSFQLALARAGVPVAGTALLTVHGRPLAAAVGPALGARRSAILTDLHNHPGVVIAALREAGMESSARVVVAELLGGPEERIREGTLADPPERPFDALAVLVVDRQGSRGDGWGRPESEYGIDGDMVTKGEVRAIALAALDPASEDVIWDLGSASGSVAIEAGRRAIRGAVYAVERRSDRFQALQSNLSRHGSWNVEAILADAGQAMGGLPPPDAVFLGCGPQLMAAAVVSIRRRAAPIRGRLVANLASLESVIEALTLCRSLGLEPRICQVQVSRGRDLGGRLGWEALNPVHILSVEVGRQ